MSFAIRRPTVLIADSHLPMRKTAAALLAPDFDIVADVKDGAAAVDEATKINPSLIVLDSRLPRLDGFGAARELARRKSTSKLLFLSVREDDENISGALRVGASGYVTKRRLHADLAAASSAVLNDQLFISPHVFRGSPKPENRSHVLQFYPGDARFFQHVAELTHAALNNKEIVFMFLSTAGISFVRNELRSRAVDYVEAIRSGQCWVLGIENALSSGSEENWPDASYFYSSVRACLNRAVANSQQAKTRLTIFSDVIPTLLRQGQSYAIAARIESVWNHVIPRHFGNVYCGCSVTHLGVKASRESLSKVCQEHSDVIAIDR